MLVQVTRLVETVVMETQTTLVDVDGGQDYEQIEDRLWIEQEEFDWEVINSETLRVEYTQDLTWEQTEMQLSLLN
jgi:hypothetical protein